MGARVLRLLKWVVFAAVVALVTVVGVRTWQIHQGPPLELWHTYSRAR